MKLEKWSFLQQSNEHLENEMKKGSVFFYIRAKKKIPHAENIYIKTIFKTKIKKDG